MKRLLLILALLCLGGCVTMSQKKFDLIMELNKKDGIIEGLKMCQPCPPKIYDGHLLLDDTVYHYAPLDVIVPLPEKSK